MSLGPSSRALLDAAREGMSPDPAAIKRMRANVDAAIGGGAPAAAAAGTGAKLGLFALVAVLAIGSGVYVTTRGRAADAPPELALPTMRSEPAQPVVRPATPMLELDPMVVARPHAGAHHPVVIADTRIDLAREVALIDQAMGALRAGDLDGALAAVHTHATETRGAGQLAEDAAAIELEALCRLHDPAVTIKLDAFDARFPRSAQRSRLTTLCP